ncbi:hypothetical protein XENORESO_012259 [Xenotaenia resolanae]|uniref:Uncharacterized protein n=1 Tax=Xenotaenia resolanae TaxID=208358 RepID=A0ABV0WIX9_9TELE
MQHVLGLQLLMLHLPLPYHKPPQPHPCHKPPQFQPLPHLEPSASDLSKVASTSSKFQATLALCCVSFGGNLFSFQAVVQNIFVKLYCIQTTKQSSFIDIDGHKPIFLSLITQFCGFQTNFQISFTRSCVA